MRYLSKLKPATDGRDTEARLLMQIFIVPDLVAALMAEVSWCTSKDNRDITLAFQRDNIKRKNIFSHFFLILRVA